MIKKLTLLLLTLTLLCTPISAFAHTAVKVNGSNVTITMGNKQNLTGKYIAQYRYVKWSKLYLRDYPRSFKTKIVVVKQGTRLGLIWQNNKWSAVMYNKKCYFCENASLLPYPPSKPVYSGAYFRRAGGLNWQGKHYTWYSRRVMPGLRVPGMWIDSQGFVRDGDGYFVCGSCVANKNKRVIVPTPFGGYAKCYDCGYVGPNHFDMYVNW